MAADLIQDSSIPHTFVHDLESVFWVLIWVVVSYMPTTWDNGEHSSFLKETMCPKVYGTRGGTRKKDFILAKQFPPVRNVDAVTRLLFVLSHLLAPRHYVDLKISLPNYALTTIDVDVTMSQNDDSEKNSKEDPNEEKPNVSPKTEEPSGAEMFPDGLRDHSMIIGLFYGALDDSPWPLNDAADPQPKLPSTEEVRFMRAGSNRSRSQAEKSGVFVLLQSPS